MINKRSIYQIFVIAMTLLIPTHCNASDFVWEEDGEGAQNITASSTPPLKPLKPVKPKKRKNIETENETKNEIDGDVTPVTLTAEDKEPIAKRIRTKPRKSQDWYQDGAYAELDKKLSKTEDDDEEDDAEYVKPDKGKGQHNKGSSLFSLGGIFGNDSGTKKSKKSKEWLEKMEPLRASPKNYQYALELLEEIENLGEGSETGATKRSQLKLLCELPWNKRAEGKIDILRAKKLLDDSHFGMEKVKTRILQYLAVQMRPPLSEEDGQGNILCFVGPPGVGKTTLCAAIAQATGRPFFSIALGGVHDEGTIRGHNPAYVAGNIGQILKKLKLAGVNNPLILLDEIDKLGSSVENGNPAYALLEVLDPGQNKKFQDHYLDEAEIDLSDVMFIATANTEESIFGPLYDRLEIIKLSSYTNMEKLEIAKRYILPKQKRLARLNPNELFIRTKTLEKIIGQYTAEAGVRKLSQKIATLCGAVALKNALEGTKSPVTIEPDMLELTEYLGPPPFLREKPLTEDTVGHTMGLAYMETGGCLLPIEATVSPGKGEVIRTGKLGDVMKESVDIAWSMVRSLVGKYGITDDMATKTKVHVSSYDAATEKDGPSAGAAIATTIISALTQTPVAKDVCMTGEITLLGTIQPIGGLKEKLMAAHRAGMKTALIPVANVPNLVDVPEIVKKELRIIPVSKISEVLSHALVWPIK